MRHLLFTSAIAAGIYAVVAILMVVGGHFLGGSLWVPAVIYIGPPVYFIGVAPMNRSAFGNIRSAALRWATLVGACDDRREHVFVFVLAVNVHVGLGGRL